MARLEEPPFQGEAVYSNVIAQSKAKGQLLGPGRWALHSRSTVPFVRVNCGAVGTRNLTWGEIYEVPPGHYGQVINGSFHDGDIILAQTGCCTAPPRPARITIAALIFEEENRNITNWVDTRMARRAYLAIHPVGHAFEGGFTYSVLQQAPTQGAPISPTGSASKNGGVLTMNRAVVQPLEEWPLGFGSGEYLDTGGKSVPELRPMSFLDRARVFVAKAKAIEIGFVAATDAFFVLEY